MAKKEKLLGTVLSEIISTIKSIRADVPNWKKLLGLLSMLRKSRFEPKEKKEVERVLSILSTKSSERIEKFREKMGKENQIREEIEKTMHALMEE